MVCFVVLGASVAVGLMAFALKDNINLFYEPARVAAGEAPVGKTIRVGGMVVKGSWDKGQDGVTHNFVLTDYEAMVPVVYTGILPDLFAENEGAVATGVLNKNGLFEADQVLAKHDENYMPPELAKALEGKHPGADPNYSPDQNAVDGASYQ